VAGFGLKEPLRQSQRWKTRAVKETMDIMGMAYTSEA